MAQVEEAEVTDKDSNNGGPTVNTVDPLSGLDAAVMVVVPWLTLLASPPDATVATPFAEEVQVAEPVKS